MLGSMSADHAEQFLSALSFLQIALVKTEAHCFASQLIYLIRQGTFGTAEYFQHVNWWSNNLGVFFTHLKFFFHHGYQVLKVPTSLIALTFMEKHQFHLL